MTLWAKAFWLGMIAVAAPQPAAACIAYQPFDPNRVLEYMSREQIANGPEVIVEGVVDQYEPSKDEAASKDSFGMTTIRVERVLKGDVDERAVLLFNTQSADCTHEPPFGQRIRFGATLLGTRELLYLRRISWQIDTMEESAYRQALLGSERYILYYENFDIPLNDPALNAVLDQRQDQTRTLERQASGGGMQAELAYATHLANTNESNRALDIYESIFRKHPDDLDLLLTLALARSRAFQRQEPETTLAEVERRAPKTDAWRLKILHTRFIATGKLTPDWKDWSDLAPTQSSYCDNRDMDFDFAVFDRADLGGCNLLGSSFRRASFLGTDLSRAYVGRPQIPSVDMSGATYNCATEFPADFDPISAGMINTEGSCAKP